MGCGTSKNKIHVVGGASTANVRDNSAKGGTRRSSKNREISEAKDATWAKKRTDSLFGSRDSLGAIPQRGGSATSKFSKHSMDSGFSDKDDSKFISENSDPNVVKKIEDGFNTPRNADNLILVGQPISQRRSAKERDRQAEESVMANLRQEGLITRPMSRAAGGLRFDIVAEESKNPLNNIRPPARLAKLEKRRKKKKTFTEEEIQAKLEKAKLRREKLEQGRLNTIKQVAHQSDVKNALDNFAQSQMAKDDSMKSKEEIAAENREKKLKALQEKLQAKKRHAEEVRKRKNLTLAPIPSNSPPISAGSRKFRESDSIVASGSMEVS